MSMERGEVKVDRNVVENILGCSREELRAMLRSSGADPHSGQAVRSNVLGKFSNGARLIARKGGDGHQFVILSSSMHGNEAQEVFEQIQAGQSVPVTRGGNA